jgi:hypothetical protein
MSEPNAAERMPSVSVGHSLPFLMNSWLLRCVSTLVFCGSFAVASAASAASEAPGTSGRVPASRPRLTEALRAEVENKHVRTAPLDSTSSGNNDRKDEKTLTMEKVIVRELPLPSGPPKEAQREGPFSVTQGGYLWKKDGRRFTVEVGLWRHLDIVEDPRTELHQTDKIRMGLVRISW